MIDTLKQSIHDIFVIEKSHGQMFGLEYEINKAVEEASEKRPFQLFSDEQLGFLLKAISAYGIAANYFGSNTGKGSVPLRMLDLIAEEMQQRGLMEKCD